MSITSDVKQDTSNAAETAVQEEIRRSGYMTVARFMEQAISHYYANSRPFGVEGDFVTAPEVSQMFGEMIGAWMTDMWLQAGKPEHVHLVELGPGRGTLMADILRTINTWPDFRDAVSIHLVETSPLLRHEQAQALKGLAPTWYETLDQVPEGFSFIFANEFFDAQPIHQLIKHEGKWKERVVRLDDSGQGLVFGTADLTSIMLAVIPDDIRDAPEGSIFEISPASLAVMEKIARRIGSSGGAALLIDYGHSVAGIGDTLQAVHRHYYSDPLQNIGSSDVTAHVDFATLQQAALGKAMVHGPVTQGEFLTSLGIVMRAEALSKEGQRDDIVSALRRLVSPEGMGRLFKVMVLTPLGSNINPAGFVGGEN